LNTEEPGRMRRMHCSEEDEEEGEEDEGEGEEEEGEGEEGGEVKGGRTTVLLAQKQHSVRLTRNVSAIWLSKCVNGSRDDIFGHCTECSFWARFTFLVIPRITKWVMGPISSAVQCSAVECSEMQCSAA
jgi:hypothetical protein